MATWTKNAYNTAVTQNRHSRFVHAAPRGLGAWARAHARQPWLDDLIASNAGPIAYSGIFACSAAAIHSVPRQVWKRLLRQLTQGDNLEAGHYMERLWGLLLHAKPPPRAR
jgi:hypothetical protein